MTELRLSPVQRADLDAVAVVHARAFPTAAISAFGHEAVRRYYSWLLDGPHDAELIGAWLGPRLVGFCSAGVFRGAMSGYLRANRLYLAWRVATHPTLVTSPLVRSRIMDAIRITAKFRRVLTRTNMANQSSAPPSFGVLSIATEPTVRQLGVASALLEEATQRARTRGFSRMVLTVHPDNDTAVRFYERRGWKREVDREQTWCGGMSKLL